MREGGMKEGCKDTLVVLLHSDAMLAMQDICMQEHI